MEPKAELAKNLQTAMEAKHMSRDQLAERLQTNPLMVDKLLLGEVVPSRHLARQLNEISGISHERIAQLVDWHDRQAKGA